MKIDYKNAQNIISHLRFLSRNPEKILAYLYPETESYDHNCQMTEFSSMIQIEGKDIYTYLENYISEALHLPDDAMVSHWGNHIFISIKGLYPDEDLLSKTFDEAERIFELDILNHTYEIKEYAACRYLNICARDYELKLSELPQDWNAIRNLKNDGTIRTIYKIYKDKTFSFLEKTQNILTLLIVPKKDLCRLIKKHETDIEITNSKRKADYEKRLKEQEFYRKYSSAHISKIKNIQKQLMEFCDLHGYTNRIKSEEESE